MNRSLEPSRVRMILSFLAAGALILPLTGMPGLSSAPEAEINVSAAAGYQGQAEVAVDPADPLILVVAGADDGGSGPTAWSSADGGASYVPVALPMLFEAHTFAEGSAPAVAVDNDGIWYAAYEVHDLDGGLNPIDSSLVVARSFDGLVWEAAAIVEDNRSAGASPSVEAPHLATDIAPIGCTSYSDRLHMAWIRKTGGDRAVYRNYSTTDGMTWTTSTKINDGVSGAEDVWRPRVAVGPDGRVYVAWLDDLLGAVMVDTATNGGATFGIDVAAAGVTVGCDTGDCGRDLGCSGGALHGSTPALVVDNSWTASRGTVYVGFADEVVPADGLDVLVTASTDNGANWSAPVQISGVATRQQYGPALAVHPIDGSLHAAWYDRRNDSAGPDCETETWHALSTDGGATFTDETAVSSSPSDFTGDARGEGANLSMAAASGKVYPAWTDNRAANHEIYLGRIAQAGGTWIPGGNISSNTTWLAADGPFIVVGDVTIDTGATLTIEAGAEVRMATCDSLRSGTDSSRVEFIVEGALNAAGTSGNEVQFHSGDPTPAKSDWYGIRFQNTADSSDSTLTFTGIQHTRYGIRLTSSSPTLEDVTIELATTNGMQGSARTAVPFSPTRVTVSDAGTPVALTGISGTWTDVTLQNSSGDAGTITGNSLDLRMVGLSVLNNSSGGLDISTSGGGLEVILSEFNGNGAGEAGLTINGSGPRTLVANDFNGNSDDGLELSSSTSGWPAVAVYASNLDGNSGAAIRMISSSLPGDARRNYWGALNAEMTEYPKNISGIWDIHDNAALRHVDFREKQGSTLANDTNLTTYLALSPTMNDNETVIYGGAVARAGVLKVEVSTDGGTIWSDATIEGAAFSMVWAPTPGVYTVMSRVTDTLMNVEAVPDQIIVTVSAGPTLSGTLLANETWTGPGTIVLQGDVVVPVGTTLTIDAGTTVHAQYLSDSTYGGLDPSRIEIIVEGVMQSNGTFGNEVAWDSSRVVAGASKGDWYGIRYLDTTTDELSIITSTEIGHGVNGVKLESAAPDIIDSTIANCSVDGLTGTSGALAKPLWALNGNTFQDNDDDGVDVTGSTEVEVINATITGNGDLGMRLNASPNVVTITGANVSGNGDDGLWINSGSTGFNLLDSTIQNNGGEGVYVSSGGSDIRLERLTVSGNTDNGIYVSSGTNLVLLKSSLTGNSRGLRIGSPRLVAAYNTITGNTGDLVPGYQGTGVYYSSGTGVPAVLEMNDIDNSVDYEIYLTSTRALKSRRNYWGVTTTTNMNGAGFPADLGEFRDIHEDRSRGVVDYDNWAAISVAGSAPGDLAAHITWPGSGSSLDVTSVVLTGVAYALDGIDRVEVCVREQGVDPVCGDGGGETPFGVVTGKEAWTFEWFPPGSGTFELQVRVVDTGDIKSVPSETVTYTVNLLGATVNGPVAISGPVIADQTWSGDIELTGDVIVEAGSTLTLAAGTTVKARALADDRLDGEDTSRIELIVRGNLVTQGTGGAPVSLSSTRIVPEKRDWYGLRFEATSDAAFNDMDWTTVDAGWHGIEFRDSWSTLDEVSCNNNHRAGLYLSSSATFPVSTTISGGSFLDNGTYGMHVRSIDGTWLLDGVEFGNNNSHGLFVWGCNADGPITLDGVNIHHNAGYGAYLWSCSRPVELLASTIDGNQGTGFYAVSASVMVARANTFTNQTGVALNLSSPGELIVSKNSFSGNRYNALISDGSGQTKVVFNEFGPWTNLTDENVTFSGGSAATFKSVHFNNFREYAPATGDVILRNAVASSINGRVNYWDPDTTAEMNSSPFPSNITSIEDVEDTGTWGRVDWRAHRSTAVDLAPPQVCGFTKPVDGDTLTGTIFSLQGAAAADVGIQLVEISTDGGTSWNPAVGEELWSFEWTPPGSANYTLQCRVTDIDAGVQGAPGSINVDVIAANITTSGVLTTDETWSGVIVLTGDVTVPDGFTLTIEEGTIVRATPQSDDQFGGLDASKIELIIEGTLDLQGSPALPITFTSDRSLPAVPTAGDWYGIRLLDSADSTVTIHDIIVEAAVRGIWGYPGSHQDVVDCIVQDMTQHGIYMQFGNRDRDIADPGMLISGNTVQRTGSSSNGIYLTRSGSNATWNDAVHQVTGNTTDDTGTRGLYLVTGNAERLEVTSNIVSNTGYGIRVNAGSSASYTNRSEVTGNQITDATSYGMYIWTARVLMLENNTVSGGNSGLYTYAVATARVANNSFSGGSGDGMVLSSSGTINMTAHRNTVTDYGDDGLVATSLSSFTALYNTITNSGGDAIQISTQNVPRIHWNNIQGSTDYDLNLTSANGADLKHNYWAATNGEMIAEGYPSEISEIFDIDDNNARGRIDYRGVENLALNTAVTLESRLVWPFDGDTMSRRTITLEGTAYADAGVQLVEVSTDGGTSWLPATGADFWTFSFTPTVDGLQEFRCRVTDNDSIVEATPDAITVTFDSALPTTEGTLPGDETWSGAILLTGDVIVPSGVTLTLDPGTVIQVQPLADNLRGGLDLSRIELIIEGALDLLGTGGSPVTLTSSRTPTPAPADWYGLRILDTAESTFTLHDLVVEYGVRGIWGYPGSHQDVVDCTVRDMTQYGIYMQFGNSPRDGGDPGMLVSGNTVERTGSSYDGIRLARSGSLASWNDAVHQVAGNTTSDTGSRGLYIVAGNNERLEVTANNASNTSYGIRINGSSSATYTNRVEATGNVLNGATSYGMYLYTGRSVLVADNTITGGNNGIYMYLTPEGRILRNILDSGTGNGITGASSGSNTNIYIERNNINGYGGDGIVTSNLTTTVALYNTITNSGADATDITTLNAAGVPRIHWNNIDGSTGYDVNLKSVTGADLRRNFWSGTNAEMQAEGYPAEISEVFDIEDNTARGRIDYRGPESLAIDTNVTLESRFVWPFDNDILTRQTLTLEGTAYADAGVQLVEISTDGGTSWLPASGTDFWTYSFTPSVDGLQEFLCRMTDGDSTVEASPDVITVDFDFSLLTTEGTLPANETWSGTVLLTGDVVVPAGTTLTIDPGTTVQLQPLADNSRGGVDWSRIELIVEGNLVAQGAGPGSILMTSESMTPAKGHWYGLRYDGLTRALTDLRNLSLEWAKKGISDSNTVGIPNLDGIDIQQMLEEGIRASNAPLGAAPWTFRNINVSLIDQIGIKIDSGTRDADVLIDNVTIQDVGRQALDLDMDATENLDLRNSTFVTSASYSTVELHGAHEFLVNGITIDHSHASGYGMYFSSSHIGDMLTVNDSEISGGNRSIYIYRVTNPTIRRSRITDGSIGVYLGGSSTWTVDALLENNRISDTVSDGVYITSYASATLHYNDLYNIGGYTLNNQWSNDIDAADNYWGEDMETEMNAKGCDANIDAIYDQYDNGSKGLVTYCDYATEPYGDQPTISFHDNGGLHEIRWNPKGGLTYDLIRGDVANLAVSLDTVDLGSVTCEEQANGSGVAIDTSLDPASGQAWFFLLRDHVTPGNYGLDSDGRERVPASGDCP